MATLSLVYSRKCGMCCKKEREHITQQWAIEADSLAVKAIQKVLH